MNNTEEYYKALREYYSNEYRKMLNTQLIDDPAVKSIIDDATIGPWSTKNRIVRNLQILKHGFLTQKANVITACFKMTLNETSCIYAFLHTRYDRNYKTKTNHTKNIFFCTGPAFRSQDGEYRGRLIPWRNFGPIFEKYSEIFETAEEVIVDYMQARELTFQVDFCYPLGCPRLKKYEDSINNQRLPIKFLILCWMFDGYQIQNKIMENHANEAYTYIINELTEDGILTDLVKEVGHDAYMDMFIRISQSFGDINESNLSILEPQCGQKMMPISALEAVRTDDPTYNVWREVYLTNLLSNLVLNLISPSFPFINNWFYVQNAHAGIFDNLAMHEKYMYSEIAGEISDKIKEVDHLNFVKGDIQKGPYNNKFYRLSRYMHKSIVYADSDIKLTDLAVCMTTEYVGRTLRDIPALITNKAHDYGIDLIFSNLELFIKHIFEFMYAFFCMNTRLNIMHGDLHLNNVTIMRLYVMVEPTGKKLVENPKIVYMVRQTPYIFDHAGLFSMIIDSSRAILGDYGRLEHEFSPRLAAMFFKEQKVRMMHIVNNYFPNLIKSSRDNLESTIHDNFPLMFKILTAVDTYVLLSNIAALLEQDAQFKKIKIADGVFDFLAKIIAMAENLILDNVHAAITGKLSSPDDIEWPNYTIIKATFADYEFKPGKKGTPAPNIVDFFNSNSDLSYDMEDYDTWGPLLSVDHEFKMREEFGLPLEEDAKSWLEYKNFDESGAITALTSKYEQDEQEVLQFESWMLL